MEKVITSKKFSLIKQDLIAALNRRKLFIAPIALMYITFVIDNMSDGFTWSDFYLDQVIIGAIILFILNFATDLINRWVITTKY